MKPTTRTVIEGLRASRRRWEFTNTDAHAARKDRLAFLRALGHDGRAILRRVYVRAAGAQ